ncbi:MAG TPA: hypothetical protein VGR10_07970, partial [Thermoleophilaceae bacterium]|nr:hypothetical protein [Thermoleophilaceae bacterium]
MLGQASAADTGRLAGPGTALFRERARSRRVPARRGALRRDEGLCAAGLAIIVLAGLAFVLSAAAGSVFLVPSGVEQFPGWLAGPLPDLGGSLPRLVEIGLVVAMGVGWAMVLRSRALLGRSTVAAIGLVHLLLLAGPPVFSTDVFGYLAFGRLGELYGLSPYSHAVGAIAVDPVNIYLSSVWPTDLSSPYGPLFLLLTYGLVPYGLTAGLWGMKVVATAAALGSVGLVARTAERLELDPVRAAAFVGLNPLWLTWVVGGAHNDLPMVLLAVAGIGLMVAGRERVSG